MDNVLYAIPGAYGCPARRMPCWDGVKKRIELSRGPPAQAMGIASAAPSRVGCRWVGAVSLAWLWQVVAGTVGCWRRWNQEWRQSTVPVSVSGMPRPQPGLTAGQAEGMPACVGRWRPAAEAWRHDVLAQTGRGLRPTVAGRISMRRMAPAEQAGQTWSERPVRAW